jgi:hypothetical protein
MSAMARRHRSEQRRLLGLRRAVRMTWIPDMEDSMGGKPSKGTAKDKRLSTNKGAKKK